MPVDGEEKTDEPSQDGTSTREDHRQPAEAQQSEIAEQSDDRDDGEKQEDRTESPEPDDAGPEDDPSETSVANGNNNNDKESDGDSPREKKKKQHFVAEFERLRSSLEKESTRIVRPDFKEYSPFIWTSLKPYYNTYTLEYMMNMPAHVRHGYTTRKTAVDLVDPEINHSMDVVVNDVPASRAMDPNETYFWMRQQPYKQKRDPSKQEGSTRLPKWPVVKLPKPDLGQQKEINWADVPKLRNQLRQTYGSDSEKRYKSDYSRTEQDWHRMELEELKTINDVNKAHMRLTCHTYLGTSPGARKAVTSLAKVLD